jgi:hypothetical protein
MMAALLALLPSIRATRNHDMKNPSHKALLLGLGLALSATPAAMADQGNGNGTIYVLEDETEHETPGAMFQYLRSRDSNLASGNPKDIVDAYPEEFGTVGELIHEKRVEDE